MTATCARMVHRTSPADGLFNRVPVTDICMCKLDATGIVALQFNYILLHP